MAWTGHRPELFARPREALRLVEQETRRLTKLAGRDVLILSGGQRGVDLWAAAAAQRFELQLRLLLPEPPAQFAAGWLDVDVVALKAAVDYARDVVVLADAEGETDPFEARNRALAAECDLLIAVWTGLGGGGTEQTIGLARAHGKPVRQRLLAVSGASVQPGERGV